MAQALLHDPGVVILDEPTDGLDPNQTREIQGIIRAIGSEKAVVVSTHALQDVEAVCSRAIIVGRGRILAGGTIAELASRSRYHNAVRLGIPNGSDPGIEAELSHLPGVRLIEPASDGDGEGWWLFPWQSRPIIDDVAALVRARRWPVTCLRAEHGRLEDVFPALTMPAQRIAAESPREPAKAAAHGTGRLISR
jgi:ABC-2 type transport system ATP-binding protein